MYTRTVYDITYVHGKESTVVYSSQCKKDTQSNYDKMNGFVTGSRAIRVIKRSVTTKLTDVTKQYE